MNSFEKVNMYSADSVSTCKFSEISLKHDAIFSQSCARTINELHVETATTPCTKVIPIL